MPATGLSVSLILRLTDPSCASFSGVSVTTALAGPDPAQSDGRSEQNCTQPIGTGEDPSTGCAPGAGTRAWAGAEQDRSDATRTRDFSRLIERSQRLMGRTMAPRRYVWRKQI